MSSEWLSENHLTMMIAMAEQSCWTEEDSDIWYSTINVKPYDLLICSDTRTSVYNREIVIKHLEFLYTTRESRERLIAHLNNLM